MLAKCTEKLAICIRLIHGLVYRFATKDLALGGVVSRFKEILRSKNDKIITTSVWEIGGSYNPTLPAQTYAKLCAAVHWSTRHTKGVRHS
jgi:hypothetical protein